MGDRPEIKSALTAKASVRLHRCAAARATGQGGQRSIASFALDGTAWVLMAAVGTYNHGLLRAMIHLKRVGDGPNRFADFVNYCLRPHLLLDRVAILDRHRDELAGLGS